MADENEITQEESAATESASAMLGAAPAPATYYPTTFVLADALAGKLVGLPLQTGYDSSNSGLLRRNGSHYEVAIGGYTLRVGDDGVVYQSIPAGHSTVGGDALVLLDAKMAASTGVGGAITRSSSTSETANLTSMEPRDHFAMDIMNAMLIHADHPEAFDEAKWLYFARAAYKGAQAMMIAAADSRFGEQSGSGTTTVDINPANLQSNTEKLLYNMAEYMKNGITVKGTTAAGTVPVQTKVTELPNVNVATMPDVKVTNALDTNDDPIPLVTDINSAPAIEVKNPLDANDEAIPLEVNSHAVTT